MEFENLLTLIDKVASTDLTDFSIDNGDFKISMKRKQKEVVVTTVPEGMLAQQAITQVPVAAASVQASPNDTIPDGNTVKAPLVGTFYNAASPENPAFVKVGDTVKKGQTLGIIEAMKLMNEIESEFDGVVEAILIENEQMVEYGQPLFVIR
ncbi:acetyl-CoA carboxylase biotin carboxyl carrier protein [uncultured Robinsoniella sp.]|uniref:acetyl-CoA carboxylase biotin carboxyl carrier protein n=1 Tax=uncultured Robinsoniella sp. TaxID=904190 RepID=UPI00374F0A8A